MNALKNDSCNIKSHFWLGLPRGWKLSYTSVSGIQFIQMIYA